MAKHVVRTRYLLSCANDGALKKLTRQLARVRSAPALASSTEVSKARRADVAVLYERTLIVSAPLTTDQLKRVKSARICRIEPDVFAHACISRAKTVEAAVEDYPYPWGIKKIDADIAWEKTRGVGAKVAVLDTGVDNTHVCLRKNVKKGVSFVENVTSARDDNGHGTHCAGIVAAHGANKGAGLYGVAPEASVYPVKVLNYNGKGLLSAVIAGLEWCLQAKVDIVSMSFRVSSDIQSAALKQACELLSEAGVLLVAAVGNDREDKKSKGLVGYPARYECVLGVGATNHFDSIAGFSNVGRGIDLVAPGVEILSTYRNGRYRELSGTSQACPHVAGVAALLKSFRRTLTNEDIKKVILETADPLGSDEPDEVYGHGLVNATGAIEQLDAILG